MIIISLFIRVLTIPGGAGFLPSTVFCRFHWWNLIPKLHLFPASQKLPLPTATYIWSGKVFQCNDHCHNVIILSTHQWMDIKSITHWDTVVFFLESHLVFLRILWKSLCFGSIAPGQPSNMFFFPRSWKARKEWLDSKVPITWKSGQRTVVLETLVTAKSSFQKTDVPTSHVRGHRQWRTPWLRHSEKT